MTFTKNNDMSVRYNNGYKYCGFCTHWFLTEEIYCPKCNKRLRIKARHYKKPNKNM